MRVKDVFISSFYINVGFKEAGRHMRGAGKQTKVAFLLDCVCVVQLKSH